MFTGLFMLGWSYFEHVLSHHYPLSILHMKTHHGSGSLLAEVGEYIYEFLFMAGFILVPFQKLIGYELLDPWTITMFALMFISVHIINYHYITTKTHDIHHTHIDKNFGPDFYDVLFGTKYQPETDREDIHHTIPNIIIFTLLVLFVKAKLPQWLGQKGGATLQKLIVPPTSAIDILNETIAAGAAATTSSRPASVKSRCGRTVATTRSPSAFSRASA
jgi:hypothetical protein